jgi:hypothetical protein
MEIQYRVLLASSLFAVFGGCSRSAEISLEFDSQKMHVLFEAISPSISSGFGEPQALQIERAFASLAKDGTMELTFPITYNGTDSELRVRIRKEDVDAVEMHFLGTQEVITKVQDIIRATALDSN